MKVEWKYTVGGPGACPFRESGVECDLPEYGFVCGYGLAGEEIIKCGDSFPEKCPLNNGAVTVQN